eukprot:comp5843_c0_seq1/m.1700 comp5843_c0_seq1/g.1700  ORF comp5843_c0_seq1/g.1700 comp5843_c0_seq1/m.1700 type:complete len:169 (-) comp5843_c0_seq1:45-551(-)
MRSFEPLRGWAALQSFTFDQTRVWQKFESVYDLEPIGTCTQFQLLVVKGVMGVTNTGVVHDLRSHHLTHVEVAGVDADEEDKDSALVVGFGGWLSDNHPPDAWEYVVVIMALSGCLGCRSVGDAVSMFVAYVDHLRSNISTTIRVITVDMSAHDVHTCELLLLDAFNF